MENAVNVEENVVAAQGNVAPAPGGAQVNPAGQQTQGNVEQKPNANDFINSILGNNSNAQPQQPKCYAGLDMEFGAGIDDATVKNFEAIINDDEDIESGKSTRVTFANVAKTFSEIYKGLSEEDKRKGKAAFGGVTDPYQRMKLMTKLYKKVINSDTRYGKIIKAGGEGEYINQLEARIAALEGAGANIHASMDKIETAANTPAVRYSMVSDPDAPMPLDQIRPLSEVFKV